MSKNIIIYKFNKVAQLGDFVVYVYKIFSYKKINGHLELSIACIGSPMDTH